MNDHEEGTSEPIVGTPVERTIRIVVQLDGEEMHSDDRAEDDNEGKWYKALLWWGIPSSHGHIEAVSRSPEAAVGMAMKVWRRNHGSE